MKIIHTADIHLGSALKSKFTKEITADRKSETMETFVRLVEKAERDGVKAILLSGDVFDSPKDGAKDKKRFFETVKSHPDIDFLYLNGNHDETGSYGEALGNLKTFSNDKLTTYTYGDVTISGIEMTDDNGPTFYDKIILPENTTNILMLHGELSDSCGKDLIKIKLLENKNIDYLALGHIHTFESGKIDERGAFAYPGCLEGRGFDECGEKGYIYLNTDNILDFGFVPFACRSIHKISIDVTNAENAGDIRNKIKNAVKDIPKKDIIKLEIFGELDGNIDFDESDAKACIPGFYFMYVDIKTVAKINAEDYRKDKTLIGEFIRRIDENPDYSEEMKQKLISLGLKAINGRNL